MLVYQNKSLIIIIALKSFCHLKTLEKHFEKFILYPATLKSAGYYVIPSIQKIVLGCPCVCTSVCMSVRPSAHCFHWLLGAFFNQFSSNLV